jgi:hypothetical protein
MSTFAVQDGGFLFLPTEGQGMTDLKMKELTSYLVLDLDLT